jgi:hypothetical protein
MSANFDALLKPPRARWNTMMAMMTVMSRGEVHCEKDYTRAGDARQGQANALFIQYQEDSGTWYAARGI